MEAYLDNSATTVVTEEVKNLMIKLMCEEYGNPSSMHLKGLEAENHVKAARERIAGTMKVQEKEIVFTSGGTESNNLAIIGAAMANQRAGKHIITTAIEHASVSNVMNYLKEQGFEITYLPVDEQGVVSVESVEQAVREDTILVSIMYVNNEIGAIQPVEEIGKCIKRIRPSILYHVDAIQAYGKLPVYPRRMNIDLLSVSGHKIHGPKGTGFLYIKDKTKIRPIIFGGGQQSGMRSGTENVPGIAGLGLACQSICENQEEKRTRLNELKDGFIHKITALEGVTVNSSLGELGAPHIISVSVEGIRSEVLLHSLEEKGVYVSAGSACSSNKPAVSATLKAIGLKKELLDSTVRFSLSLFTTEEELNYAVETLSELLGKLRIYKRK